MKFPNSFRPEKDLDKKINELHEGSTISRKAGKLNVNYHRYERAIKMIEWKEYSDPEKFNATANAFDYEINRLALEAGYERTETSKTGMRYYTLPSERNDELRLLLKKTKRFEEPSPMKRWSFATIKKNDLEEVIKTYEETIQQKNTLKKVGEGKRANGHAVIVGLLIGSGGLTGYIVASDPYSLVGFGIIVGGLIAGGIVPLTALTIKNKRLNRKYQKNAYWY